jgi:hypothetical protein
MQNTTSHLGLEPPREAAVQHKREIGLRQAGARTIVWLHQQADRMDLVPPEFGDEKPVDRADAGSLLKEWVRQARLWAGYNPEQVLGLKVGAVALGVALVLLVALVGAIR